MIDVGIKNILNIFDNFDNGLRILCTMMDKMVAVQVTSVPYVG